MSLSKSPVYNLKAVLKETGISADTLRAWERRYGVPLPQRTPGGHRLYSQFDIETIKWLIARQAEGLSISRAVDVWNEHNASGREPLADAVPFSAADAQTPYQSPENSLSSLRARWLEACLNFNEIEAEQVLNHSFAMYPVEKVCTEVLQRGLAEIGSLWYENRASVQQEHFASGLAMRRLDTLISASPNPTRGQTILIGCPSNEWHTLTPLLLALLLRRRGLNVIYLGANVPAEQFEETVTAVRADLVILVAQTLTSAAELHATAMTLQGLQIPVGYGGRIFLLRPNLVNHIPGHYLGNSIESALDEVDMLVKSKFRMAPFQSTTQEYLSALQAFTSKRTHIESTIKEMVQPFGIDPEGLNTGIQFLGDSIIAALQLGDMQHVTAEMEWLKVLMQSHQRPPNELAQFMETYSQAVNQHINGSGAPIKAWLKTQSESLKGIQ